MGKICSFSYVWMPVLLELTTVLNADSGAFVDKSNNDGLSTTELRRLLLSIVICELCVVIVLLFVYIRHGDQLVSKTSKPEEDDPGCANTADASTDPVSNDEHDDHTIETVPKNVAVKSSPDVGNVDLPYTGSESSGFILASTSSFAKKTGRLREGRRPQSVTFCVGPHTPRLTEYDRQIVYASAGNPRYMPAPTRSFIL